MSIDLDRFLEDAQTLKEGYEEGVKIAEAARKGHVKTEMFYRDPALGYDGEIRSMIAEFVAATWHSKHRGASLAEIFQGVREKVSRRIDDHDWPSVWGFPIKRTVDRRTNETASTKFYEIPLTICLKPGVYMINPMLFEPEVREEILKVAKR